MLHNDRANGTITPHVHSGGRGRVGRGRGNGRDGYIPNKRKIQQLEQVMEEMRS